MIWRGHRAALGSLQRFILDPQRSIWRTSQLLSLSSFGSVPQHAVLLDGRAVAAAWQQELAHEVALIRSKGGRSPGLGVILVGDRPDSVVYIHRKQEACELIGVHSIVHRLPSSTPQNELRRAVAGMCANPSIDGVLVQLPLPPHVNEEGIIEGFDPEKDVDGFHPLNVGRTLMRGRRAHFVPCTALGCVELLRRSGVTIRGRSIAIVGDSNIVGMPLAMLLRDEGASTVTVVHKTSYSGLFTPEPQEGAVVEGSRRLDRGLESPHDRAEAGACLPHHPGPRPYEISYSSACRDAYASSPAPDTSPSMEAATSSPSEAAVVPPPDLPSHLEELKRITRTADILIVAIGYPRVVKGDWIKPGAVVLDVGINVVDEPDEELGSRGSDAGDGRCACSGGALNDRGEGDGSDDGMTQWSPEHPNLHVVGDVDLQEACRVASAVSPVPGGVGPMTIAALLHNTTRAAAARLGVKLKEEERYAHEEESHEAWGRAY
jgi:5,10-methylene-tetrahydrofolate dehydrogenase/methenyl tetrahydrofolate cyclohydrolase